MADEESTPEIEILLRNAESENSQYMKSIDDERRKIEVFEIQIKTFNSNTKALDELTDNLDQETKNLHLQFTQSRDITESLKKATSLLSQKEVDLQQKINAIQSDSITKREEQDKIVNKYKCIFMQYQTKYELHPLAKERTKYMKVAHEAENKVKNLCEQTSKLKIQVDTYKAKAREPEEWKKVIIAFAKSRVNIIHALKEINEKKKIKELDLLSDECHQRPLDIINPSNKSIMDTTTSSMQNQNISPFEERPPVKYDQQKTNNAVDGFIQNSVSNETAYTEHVPPIKGSPRKSYEEIRTPKRPSCQSPLIYIPKLKGNGRKIQDSPMPNSQMPVQASSNHLSIHKPSHRLIRTPPPLLFCQTQRERPTIKPGNRMLSVRATEKLQAVNEISTPPTINTPRQLSVFTVQAPKQIYITKGLSASEITNVEGQMDNIQNVVQPQEDDQDIEMQLQSQSSLCSNNDVGEDTQMNPTDPSFETPQSSQECFNPHKSGLPSYFNSTDSMKKQFQSLDQSPGFMFQSRPMFNDTINNISDVTSPNHSDGGFHSTDSFFTFANQSCDKRNNNHANFMFNNHGNSSPQEERPKSLFGQGTDDNDQSRNGSFSFLGMATASSPSQGTSQTTSGFQFNFNTVTSPPATPSARFSFL